jgi:hypothetical protein
MLPDPIGLFLVPVKKKAEEKQSDGLRIGQDTNPSAELSRTASYSLMPFFNPPADSLPESRRRAKRNSQSLLPINYFCKVRM